MRKFLLVSILLISVSTVFAQGISFGPRVGMNISKLTNIHSDAKLGLNIGAFFTGYFTKSVGIEVAAMFSQEGAKYYTDVPALGNHIDVKTRLNYINFPVVVKVRLLGGLNVYAGPQFGLLASARNVYDKMTYDVKDYFKTLNMSGVVGVGYRFNGGFDIGVNYNFGFAKATSNSNVNSIPNNPIISSFPKTSSGTWQLILGFAF